LLVQRGDREQRPGADLTTDRDEKRYVDTVLRAGRAALVAASERPLAFALVAGRDRVMTLALTVVAQFLARPTDLIVDLRVDPPRAWPTAPTACPSRGTGLERPPAWRTG